MADALVCSNLVRDFGKHRVLNQLDFRVPAGQRVAVIGPSGAGKTTLLRMLSGVLWPTEGSVTLLGHDTRTLRARALRHIRQQVGVLYQSDNLVPGLRVVHNVNVGRASQWPFYKALWSLIRPVDPEGVRAALRRVEIEDKFWSLPTTLSGGQQQRVAIARMILQQPEVMLADEPVSALDMRLGREVIELLTGLSREQGSTLVVSLHSLELLGTHFDRVIALTNGEVVWDGPPSELTHDDLRTIYGVEYRSLHLEEVALGSGR